MYHPRRLRLVPSPESVAAARRLASDVARSWDLGLLADDLVLVVSELVTNAVLHARTPLEVTLEQLADGVRVEVRDGSSAPLRPHPLRVPDGPPSLLSGEEDTDALEQLLSIGATTGRGLGLVGSVATSWGFSPVPAGKGKVVWAELRTGDAGAAVGRPTVNRRVLLEVASGRIGDVDRSHPVRLVAVPVRLALESAMNLESVLREFQVMDLTGGPPEPAGELVAAANGILDRYPSLRQSVQDALAVALDRGDRLVDVDLLVPPDALLSLHRLNDLLDDVSRYCERGELLALAPSKELRAFRAWYVEELERQTGGQPPRPCPFSTVPAADDDSTAVTELSPEARRGIDRIADELDRARDPRAVVELLLSEAVRSLGATSASLSLRVSDSDTVEVVDSIGMDQAVAEHWRYSGLADDLPASEAIRTGRPIFVRTPLELDVRYPVFRGRPLQWELSFVSVPLAGDGQPATGALNVSFARSRDFTPGDLRLLSELCRLVAGSLERVGAAGREERRREREQLVEAVTSAMGAAPAASLESRLKAVVVAVADWFGGWCDAFARPGGGTDGSSLRHVAGSHSDPLLARQMADMHRRWPPQADVGAIARCIAARETVVFQVIPDELLVRTAHSPEHLEVMRQLGFRSLVAAPVCDGGDVVAVLGVACQAGRYFTDEEVHLLEEVARRASR